MRELNNSPPNINDWSRNVPRQPKTKAQSLPKIKATKTEILRIEEQLEVLNQAVQDQEIISAAAKEVVTKAIFKRSQFAERLKKWKAAAINTSLIEARSELAELASLEKDDPSIATKIVVHKRKCDDLSSKYQALRDTP